MEETDFKPYTLVCGHYGCGKTNLSLNMACDLAGRGEKVALVDLDIVNPYFRSSDQRAALEARGIRLIAPGSAGTTLDVPALPAEIAATFGSAGDGILDVGGADAGAPARGRFSGKIKKLDYDMLYVVNKYRPLTSGPIDAARLLGEIEAASRLKATGLVNNSHLMHHTTAETIMSSLRYAEELAASLGLPLTITTAPKSRADRHPMPW